MKNQLKNMNQLTSTNSPPDWANGCPSWIVEKAKKDLTFYKGLDLETEVINIEPTGLFALSKPIWVTVTGIDYMTIEDEWVDVFWKVDLSHIAETAIRQELAESRACKMDWAERLDPYLPGFTYQVNLESETIDWYYRAWRQGY